jgi:hypothetical protein
MLDVDSANALPFMVSDQILRCTRPYHPLRAPELRRRGPRCGRDVQTAVLHLDALDASPAVRCSG